MHNACFTGTNSFYSLLHVQLPFLKHAYSEFLMNRNNCNVRIQRINQELPLCETKDLEG